MKYSAFIYILKLKSKKYYIGKTTNTHFNLDFHFNPNESTWTKKYTPISLLQFIPTVSNYDLDTFVIKYMEMVGVGSVRGGSFTHFKLTTNNKNIITQGLQKSKKKNLSKIGQSSRQYISHLKCFWMRTSYCLTQTDLYIKI